MFLQFYCVYEFDPLHSRDGLSVTESVGSTPFKRTILEDAIEDLTLPFIN